MPSPQHWIGRVAFDKVVVVDPGTGEPSASPVSTPTVTKLLDNVTAVSVGASLPGVLSNKTFQASGKTTSGAGAATVLVRGSNNGSDWNTIGTISLTLGVASSSDSLTSLDRFAFVRGEITALSGTGATVTLTQAA